VIVILEVWQLLEIIKEEKGLDEFGRYSLIGMEWAIDKYFNGRYNKEVHEFIRKNRLKFAILENYLTLNKKFNEYEKLNKRY
jgi:hypothetical protein